MQYILYICIILCLLAISVAILVFEYPALRGLMKASGASEFRCLRPLAGLVMAGAVVLSVLFDNPVSDAAADAAGDLPAYGFLAVGLSVILSFAVSKNLSPFMAVPYAFICALLGYHTAIDGRFDVWPAVRYVVLWVGFSFLCLFLAMLFYWLIAFVRNRSGHLLKQGYYYRFFSLIFSLFMLGAYAWNNCLMVTLFPEYLFGNTIEAAGMAIGVIAITAPFLLRNISVKSWSICDDVMDINSPSILASILSVGVTFAISPVPLSAECLMVSALCGISYLRHKALIEGEFVWRTFVATVVSSLSGFISAYAMGMMLRGTVFSSVMAIIIIGSITVMVMYMTKLRRKEIENRVLAARQRQMHSTEQSLSALEVRAEMNEMELLNKLEVKRKELVDFAVGVSDQKEFMEKVYDGLQEVRDAPDGAPKNKQLDQLLSSIRQRMYFTREMNDFYARSEVLHSDFNSRLSEAYPDLTEGERKLAVLLRQGFTSKYIATLMNITPKSVEISRYRLRLKLGLGRSDNLVKFIKSI
ncbi:MAG: response regulator transcription factor [Bacteroidales bacterium]|nr:response regulator transcription factor [Bacteroidales bacterium]